MTTIARSWLAGLIVLLMGCDQAPPSPPPPPAALTNEAIGHYCGMMVTHHKGPKGQIFLKSRSEPVWFTSVRDTLAFTRLPEEPKDIVAIYVNDMGQGEWDHPDDSTWIDAHDAFYVVGSSRAGGMGGAELIPFSDRKKAEAFAAKYGGQIMRLDEIPESQILGPTVQPAG